MAIDNRFIIKQEYFDNIKIAIDALNEFFTSNFEKRNFPVIDSEYQVDETIANILKWMDYVEPSWLQDPSKVDRIISDMQSKTENILDTDVYSKIFNDNDTETLSYLNSYIGYKMLQFISDNFETFSRLINGIYSFTLYSTPSMYKNDLDTMSQPIDLGELDDVFNDTQFKLFDSEKYITSVFNNPQITLPKHLKLDNEIERFNRNEDIADVNIVVDNTVQEAAEVNYFKDMKNSIISYNEKTKKFKITAEYEKKVNKLISDIKACNSTKDLGKFINTLKKEDVNGISKGVIPFIFAKVFYNPKKYNEDMSDTNPYEYYKKSYESIVDKNNGAKRFYSYDIFSTFKTDKDGTIKFLSDFLKLNIINKDDCYIANNTLLTIFNIFDSHIYYEILYSILPESETKNMDVNTFIKEKRGIINKNSRAHNIYEKDNNKPSAEETVEKTDAVVEYTHNILYDVFDDDMTIADMQYCESYHDLLYNEIACLSESAILSLDEFDDDKINADDIKLCQEYQITGEMPNYMKSRIRSNRVALPYQNKEEMKKDDAYGYSSDDDDAEDNSQFARSMRSMQRYNTNNDDEEEDDDFPSLRNSIPELVDSLEARMDSSSDDLSDIIGSEYKPNENKSDSKVVYNITINNTNSYNKNDLSSDKTITHSNSHNNTKHHSTDANNNNNSKTSLDTKDSSDNVTLSSGVSLQEMFTFLESEEPLSYEMDAVNNKKPKNTLLTRSLDKDREKLPKQQKLKKGVQTVTNNTRAVLKPISRTKQWLTNQVDSLITRDEDRVKREIVDNPSYRSSLYKAARLAVKLGLTGLAFTINGYLGAAVLGVEGLKLADKNRLRDEAAEEYATEIKIINLKIDKLKSEMHNSNTSSKRRQQAEEELYITIRERDKIVKQATRLTNHKVWSPKDVA